MQRGPKKCITLADNFSSPGPVYRLPGMIGQKDHDKRSGFKMNPAYSISGRFHGPDISRSSPGPAFYNVDTKFKERGRSFSPEIALRGRLKSAKENKNPSPVEYSVNSGVNASKKKPPIFSMGNKFEIPNNKTNSPGPKYKLPEASTLSVYKSSPKYTLVGKPVIDEKERSPGPANYSLKYKSGTPRYTMGAKNDKLNDINKSPGPAAYYPIKNCTVQRRACLYAKKIISVLINKNNS